MRVWNLLLKGFHPSKFFAKWLNNQSKMRQKMRHHLIQKLIQLNTFIWCKASYLPKMKEKNEWEFGIFFLKVSILLNFLQSDWIINQRWGKKSRKLKGKECPLHLKQLKDWMEPLGRTQVIKNVRFHHKCNSKIEKRPEHKTQ